METPKGSRSRSRSRSPKRHGSRSRSASRSRSGSPRRSRSPSPKTFMTELFLNPKHENVFQYMQKNYMEPEDRISLRQVAKGVNVVGDKELDKLFAQRKKLHQKLMRLELSRKQLEEYFYEFHALGDMEQKGYTFERIQNIRDKIENQERELFHVIKELFTRGIVLDARDQQLIRTLRSNGKVDQYMNWKTKPSIFNFL